MIDKRWIDRVKEKEKNKRTVADWRKHEIEEKIDHYKQVVKELAEVKKIAIR